MLGLALLVAGLAAQLNVSATLGAFLVGVSLSGPLAESAAELLRPLRGFFAAVFFVFFGLRRPGRLRAGVALIARGEFSIVIADLATAAAAGATIAIDPRFAPLAGAYVLLLAVAGPLGMRVLDCAANAVTPRTGDAPLPPVPAPTLGSGDAG